MKAFKFYHLTDLHYYANDVIGSYGKSFEVKRRTEHKLIAESGAIVDAVFNAIVADKDTDIVLISGDLTYDGEAVSHDMLKNKLQYLKDNGKKVYVTFATHDFNMHARKYEDDNIIDLPKYNRAELRKLYNDFGFAEALSEHENSYSYCVQLTEDTRLLCLNDDGNFGSFCGYYNDLLCWIKQQVESAKKNGCNIIAMTHHPIQEPSPIYPIYSHKDMLGGYEYIAPLLADLGVKYVFVGHTHIHNISSIVTSSGNKQYQINTGALTSHPLLYRKIEYSDKGMAVKSVPVENIAWDTNGLSAVEYAKEHFRKMLGDIFYSLAYDYDLFTELAPGISIGKEKAIEFKKFLNPAGKFLNSLTFENVSAFLRCKPFVDSSIADKKIVDFVCDTILNMYGGTENCSPEKAEYKAFVAICDKASKIVKLRDSCGNVVNLKELAGNILYDSGIDDINAFLP